MASRISGKVKFYDQQKGFGFIADNQDGEYFLGRHQLNGINVTNGDLVSFVPKPSQKGKPLATAINLISERDIKHIEKKDIEAGRKKFAISEGLHHFNLARAENIAKSKMIKNIIRIILLPSFIVALLLMWNDLSSLSGFLTVVAPFGFVFFLTLGAPSGALSKSQYTTLPGVTTENGKLRCVHCGHVGVHVSGRYQSEIKDYRCSSVSCGADFYED